MGLKMPDLKKLFAKLLTPQGTKILLIVGITGIALIFLSEVLTTGRGKAAVASAPVSSSSLSDYTTQVEQKIQTMISSIQGVGSANVMVTFENGVENVYEQQQKQTKNQTEQTQTDGGRQVTQNDNDETTPVIVTGNDGGQQTVLQKQLMPRVQGVVVVCDGGNDPTVQEAITQAVGAAFDVPSNHVFVARRSSENSR